MTDTPEQQDPVWEAIPEECARIGFDLSDLGGLALAGQNAETAFLNLLRQVPTGAGIEGLRQHLPNGAGLLTAEDELRELTRDLPTTCSFCGRARTSERHLVFGPGTVAICSECVRLAAETLL